MGEGTAGLGIPNPKNTTDIHPDLRAPEGPWKVEEGTRRAEGVTTKRSVWGAARCQTDRWGGEHGDGTKTWIWVCET